MTNVIPLGPARLCKSAQPGIHRDVNLRICSSDGCFNHQAQKSCSWLLLMELFPLVQTWQHSQGQRHSPCRLVVFIAEGFPREPQKGSFDHLVWSLVYLESLRLSYTVLRLSILEERLPCTSTVFTQQEKFRCQHNEDWIAKIILVVKTLGTGGNLVTGSWPLDLWKNSTPLPSDWFSPRTVRKKSKKPSFSSLSHPHSAMASLILQRKVTSFCSPLKLNLLVIVCWRAALSSWHPCETKVLQLEICLWTLF